MDMPEVRFFKAFRGKPEYENITDLEDVEGLTSIVADDFPHTETDVYFVGLVRVEAEFHGEISIRRADAPDSYNVGGAGNQTGEPIWATLIDGPHEISVTEPGTFTAYIFVDDIQHKGLHLPVTKS